MAHYNEQVIKQDERENSVKVVSAENKINRERIDCSELAKIISKTLGKDAKGRPNYLGEGYEDSVRAQYEQIRQMYRA